MSDIKNSAVKIHNAIESTTTSAEINTKGYNAIIIQSIITVASKNWTTKIQGSLVSGGTFSDFYDNGTLCSFQTNGGKVMLFKGLPQFIKIDITEDEDTGKATVWYQLIKL